MSVVPVRARSFHLLYIVPQFACTLKCGQSDKTAYCFSVSAPPSLLIARVS